MAIDVGAGKDPLQSEINVTPLVDVVLVLLIIFMVIVPLTMRGYDIDIPGESSAASPPDETRVEQIVLAIEADRCPVTRPVETAGLPGNCRVRINDSVIAVDELSQRVADTFAGRSANDRVLFLAADDRLNYEGVIRILDLARAATPDLRIGFVSER